MGNTTKAGLAALLATLFLPLLGLLMFVPLFVTGNSESASSEAIADIPPAMQELYIRSAEEHSPDIPWQVIAAVGKIESDHGRWQAPGVTSGVNRYGCCAGPMQFYLWDENEQLTPFDLRVGERYSSTWGSVSVDGDGDGWRRVHDPDDAVPTAALYLQSNISRTSLSDCPSVMVGAFESDVKRALFGYNNSCTYVQDVLLKAEEYMASRYVPSVPDGSIAGPQGQYLNGNLPDEVLAPIGGGHRLWPSAANAFLAMQAAAAEDGIVITVSDSYRPLHGPNGQHACVAKKGLYSQGGLCAKPGTSKHGWGMAVDVGGGPQRAWLRLNAHRFGFRTIPREPWHWQYDPADVR